MFILKITSEKIL